jgi:hypothetical protein
MSRPVLASLLALLTLQALAQGQTRPNATGASTGAVTRTAWAQDVPVQPTPTQPSPIMSGPPPLPPALVVGPDASATGPAVDWNDAAPAPSEDRFWAQAAYLMWFSKAGSTPPLVTSSPNGTSSSVAGALSQSDTRVVFGSSSSLDDNLQNGGRLELGWYLDEQRQFALVGNFFILSDASSNASFSSDANGGPILARPYTDWATQQPAALLISYPGQAKGSIAINSSSSVWGAELYLRRELFGGPGETSWSAPRVDWLAGARFLQFRERLSIDTTSTALAGNATLTPGTVTRVADAFDTENYALVGELGAVAQWQWGGLFLDVTGKLGFAGNHQVVEINGATRTEVPGSSPTSTQGGFLTQQTNISRHAGGTFSFIPEIGLQLSYAITPNIRLSAGYTFLYWTDVLRPGDQIDTVINASQLNGGSLTGDRRPAVLGMRSSDLWLQGITLGVEWRY